MSEAIAVAPRRTWDELREEVQARTDRQVYPMTGMRSEDVRIILSRIGSLDRDEWGQSWSDMGREWMRRGESLQSTDRAKAAQAFLMAWRYASFGGWPIAITPKKRASYELSLDAFRRYGALLPQPIETIQVPMDGASLTVYLQLPQR